MKAQKMTSLLALAAVVSVAYFQLVDSSQSKFGLSKRNSSAAASVGKEKPKKLMDHKQQDGDKSSAGGKQPEVAKHKGGGQLESFNVAATGLGDMEASDALKKMNKRSSQAATAAAAPPSVLLLPFDYRGYGVDLRQPIEAKRTSGAYYPQSQPIDTMTAAEARELLAPIKSAPASRYDISIEPPPRQRPFFGYASRPILVERRAEELADEIPIQQSLEDISEEEVPAPMGEFSSKVSLLTMRKTPSVLTARYGHLFGPSLEESAVDSSLIGVTPSPGHDDDAEPLSSQVLITATEPSVPRRLLYRNQQQTAPPHQYQHQPRAALSSRQLVDLGNLSDDLNANDLNDTNYLPRIARASYMK